MAGDISIGVVVTWIFRDMKDAETGEPSSYWIDIDVDGEFYGSLGPFETEAHRDRAHADVTQMLRSLGGTDVPNKPQ